MVKRNKYGARKCEEDGYAFDSTAERSYYHIVRQLDRDGEIDTWELHPRYEILPTQRKFGYTIRSASYSPDFRILYATGIEEFVEVKGARCIIGPDSSLRMKMFNFRYPDRRLRLWTPKEGFLS